MHDGWLAFVVEGAVWFVVDGIVKFAANEGMWPLHRAVRRNLCIFCRRLPRPPRACPPPARAPAPFPRLPLPTLALCAPPRPRRGHAEPRPHPGHEPPARVNLGSSSCLRIGPVGRATTHIFYSGVRGWVLCDRVGVAGRAEGGFAPLVCGLRSFFVWGVMGPQGRPRGLVDLVNSCSGWPGWVVRAKFRRLQFPVNGLGFSAIALEPCRLTNMRNT